jgi:hypothetical protein
MPNYLWAFSTPPASYTSSSQPTGATGGDTTTSNAVVSLPILTASGNQTNTTATALNNKKFNQIVNVVRDFYWTYSKPGDSSRLEVPRIILTERRLRTNALISQLKYSLGAVIGDINGITQDLNSSTKLTNLLQKYGYSKDLSGASQFTASTASTLNNLSKELSQIIGTDDNTTVQSSPYLQPFRNLYLTEPTNWVYTLPYFDDNQANQANQFSDSGTPVKGPVRLAEEFATNAVTELADFGAALASPTQVTYVEKAKFFNYGSDGETINITFPLINTGSVTYDDVVKNWQFLFLLLYQNRPGKTGYNTVDQPVIYQAEVPGTKFFPYCYVSNINIDFVGSRREMAIKIPSITTSVNNTQTSVNNIASTTSIKTIIPDAYKVTITLQSMTSNTRNFMAHMIAYPGVITTGTA